jgi:DNA-binding beta-propeller fold protein YncE
MSRLSSLSGMRQNDALLVLGLALALSCTHNRPDAPAVPIGPDTVEIDWSYSFKTWTFGPDSGPVHARFDWGDGQISPWMFPVDTAEYSHSWSQSGVYHVRAQAHDNRSELSEWSAPGSVTAIVPSYPFRHIRPVRVTDENPLYDAQVLPNGEFVYVPDIWEDVLSVVRTSDLRFVAQIPLNNGSWGDGVQVMCSPNSEYVYVVPYSYDYVGVVRTADQVVVDSMMLGEATSSAISSDGRHLYVAVDADPGFLIAVRLPDDVVEDTICTLGYSYLTSLEVAPDGTRLYAAVQRYDERGHVCAIRLSDRSTGWQVPTYVVQGPGGIVLNTTGSYLYALEDERVLVLETGGGAVIDSVPLSHCMSAEVAPDGSVIYVACSDSAGNGAVAVVRTSENKALRFIEMPDGVEALDVAPTPDGQKLYVAADDGRLYVLGR